MNAPLTAWPARGRQRRSWRLFALPWLALAAAHLSVSAQTVEAARKPESSAAQLLAAGRFADALPMLERRVMLHPDDISAWIDFAQATWEVGREDDALEILAFVERELGPGPDARRRIAALRQGKAPLLAQPPTWRAEVSLLSGHESNANAGPSVRDITFFNLPGEAPSTLPLTSDSLPQSSASHLLEARAEHSLTLGQDRYLSTSLDWRQRTTPGARSASSRQWQAETILSLPGYEQGGFKQRWTLAASFLDLDYGGKGLYQRQRLSLASDQRFDLRQGTLPCRAQVGYEREWRRYPAQDGLSSRFDALQAAAFCVSGPHRWLLVARIGQERPHGERAGGAQWRRDLSLSYRRELGQWGSVETQGSYSSGQDADIYSELFGPIRRHTGRSQLNLHYTSRPFAGGLQALVRLELFHQRSNLELFRLRGRSIHAGVKYSF